MTFGELQKLKSMVFGPAIHVEINDFRNDDTLVSSKIAKDGIAILHYKYCASCSGQLGGYKIIYLWNTVNMAV